MPRLDNCHRRAHEWRSSMASPQSPSLPQDPQTVRARLDSRCPPTPLASLVHRLQVVASLVHRLTGRRRVRRDEDHRPVERDEGGDKGEDRGRDGHAGPGEGLQPATGATGRCDNSPPHRTPCHTDRRLPILDCWTQKASATCGSLRSGSSCNDRSQAQTRMCCKGTLRYRTVSPTLLVEKSTRA